jgi:hypothetical protein
LWSVPSGGVAEKILEALLVCQQPNGIEILLF